MLPRCFWLLVCATAPLIHATAALAAVSNVAWVDSTFAEAKARAAEEKVPMMVDVYATWCGPCHLLDRKVFTDPTVVEASAKWIAVKVDGELGEGPALAKRYNVVGYPTVLFLDPEGKEIDRVFGFVEAPVFAQTMAGYLEGRGTLQEAAAAALAHPADLQAALDVGTRFAVRGDAAGAYRHFARILEARARTNGQARRISGVRKTLQTLTGDPAVRAATAKLGTDLAPKIGPKELDEMAAEVYLVLGKYLFLRGRKDNRRALKVLTALERDFPRTPQAKEAPYHIAVALQRSRKAAEARRRLAAYLASESGSAAAANTVAWFCYRERAHLAWGKSVAKKALVKEPDNGALWDTLAELEGAEGRWQQALEAEQKAVVADPEEPYYQLQVGRFQAAAAHD